LLAPLLPRLLAEPGLRDLASGILQPGSADLRLSVVDVAKPAAVAALHAALQRPLLLIVGRSDWARRYADELALWAAEPGLVLHFPATDALPYEPLTPDPDQSAERLAVLARLLSAEVGPLIVTSVRAVADKLMAPERFNQAAGWARTGQQVSPRALIERWLDGGYEPAAQVEGPGQFARRGGIVDVFPGGLSGEAMGLGYRLEFWGDEIDSIRSFDPVTQRSIARVDAVFVPPASEVLGEDDRHLWPARTEGEVPPPRPARLHVLRGRFADATLLDYVPADAAVLIDEPAQVASRWDELRDDAESLREDLTGRGELPADLERPYVPWDELQQRIERSGRRVVTLEHDPERETLPIAHAPVFAGRMRHFVDHVAGRQAREPASLTVIVSQQTARLSELLAERGLQTTADPVQAHGIVVLHAALSDGWRSDALGLELFSDSELFGVRKVRRPVRRSRRAASPEAFLAELSEGDLVVHVDHGIARYRGLIKMARSGADGLDGGAVIEREYLQLEYAEGDRLYVPADQADRVGRYIGGGDAAPSLTRLGTTEWARAKQRVRRAVRDIAQELLELYASRQHAEGFASAPDAAWQTELEAAFPYVETSDQVAAIQEVKDDMEKPRPMDRLLVGDVGYGKTEVALRAAFKAVLSGKQVAVLVPTTVLAQQHFNTFRERLGAFPVRIEMLSRFRSERDQRAVVEALAAGAVDIVIGTHRLVQKDVRFKDLGLVIIDEEQRFGVAHKERLKQLRREVDVLTLTATPIPRTLHMALSGVRDMSTIETAPENRIPIRTYLAEHDEGLLREAIVREIERGGQVYLVHNRVQGIETVANRVKRLVPEARVAIAHGQMHEDRLERAMLDFAAGDIDVLVCTTIIESGLDIPNVNTIIVNNAHRFGLAQLYQLRGRVGRGAARAYAYFFYARDGQLTPAAEQRLRAIFEATELGAGFRIAMKDLEIRGAGNLLGAEQSGHIADVGFDLYTRLLGEAVHALQAAQEGRPVISLARAQPSLDLPIEAFLPEEYVPGSEVRLTMYQRLASVESGPELGTLVEELEDRFGPLPAPAQNLVYLVSLRLAAARVDITEIASQGGQVIVKFPRRPEVDAEVLSRVAGTRVQVGSNQFRFAAGAGSAWMPRLMELVERCAAEPDAAGAAPGRRPA
jgi:transcription-repair coupling factor (superfamily II helicase)